MNCSKHCIDGWETEECPTCEHSGWVEDNEDGGTKVCPECDGDAANQCEHCEGSGIEP